MRQFPLSQRQPQSQAIPTRAVGARVARWTVLVATMVGAMGLTLLWLHWNVLPYGRDAGGHLATSLQYLPLLDAPSLRSLFEVLLVNGYRPPLLYLSTLPFYALLGVGFDSALYANVVWLGLALGGVYALGCQLRDHRTGLLAVGLYALFPFVHGLARLFYFETALAAFVAWSLALLLASERFTARRWTLLWGLCMGLGMLLKWTLPATIALPTLLVLWRSDMWREAWAARRAPRVAWRGAALAALGGAALAALFLWPSRDLVALTAPGAALGPLLALVWGATIYAWQRPARPLANLATALLLAASLMAVWYLVQASFVENFVDAAYLGADGRDAPFEPFQLRTYTYYASYLVGQLIGPLLTLLLLPLAWPWLRAAGRRAWPAWVRPDAAAVLWLAIASTYLVFTLARYNSERSMLALLVPLAAVLAAGAWALRPAALRGALLLAIVGVGALQLATYTLPAATPLWQANEQAAWPLLARGEFLQPPAAGKTDPRYWIAPDVLATIDAHDDDPASFGMLVNSEAIHRGPFRYLIAAEGLPIELSALTEKGDGWGDLFANQWVLVKDGDNGDVEAGGREAIARVEAGDGLFELLYAPVTRYELPNGETATLFHRDTGPAFPRLAEDWLAATAPLAEALDEWWTDDALLLLPDPDLAVWLAVHGPRADRAAWLRPDAPPAEGATLFALLPPDAHAERAWLDSVAFHAADVVSERATLALYGQPTRPLDDVAATAGWPTLRLTGALSHASAARGSVLPVELALAGTWPESLKLSARLVDGVGNVVAQNDVPLGETVRLGLWLPPDATPGPHTVTVVLYDAATLQPIASLTGPENVPLFQVDAVE